MSGPWEARLLRSSMTLGPCRPTASAVQRFTQSASWPMVKRYSYRRRTLPRLRRSGTSKSACYSTQRRSQKGLRTSLTLSALQGSFYERYEEQLVLAARRAYPMKIDSLKDFPALQQVGRALSKQGRTSDAAILFGARFSRNSQLA